MNGDVMVMLTGSYGVLHATTVISYLAATAVMAIHRQYMLAACMALALPGFAALLWADTITCVVLSGPALAMELIIMGSCLSGLAIWVRQLR